MRNTRPRTFKEAVLAQDPTKMARLERGDGFEQWKHALMLARARASERLPLISSELL
jgi:hypothetical protein